MDTIAAYQNIIEDNYIPMIIGSRLGPYTGYNPLINPSIDEFCSTLSFRYGHSSLSGIVNIFDENYQQMPNGPFLLRDVLLNDPARMIKEFGIESFLRGYVSERGKAVDASIVDDLNFFVKATSAIDIQRSRDVGLPSYNRVREVFGLSRIETYEDLAGKNTSIATILQNLYGNDVDKVDAYVGALIEKKESEHNIMGPILTKSLKDQFSRLRDGDRFWYKSRYDLEAIKNFPSLSDIIQTVSFHDDVIKFPSDAFITFDASNAIIAANDRSCSIHSTKSFSLLE